LRRDIGGAHLRSTGQRPIVPDGSTTVTSLPIHLPGIGPPIIQDPRCELPDSTGWWASSRSLANCSLFAYN